jgi:7,8-dihydropterin-6-yl-methyl-4-(beta-D-ribofuranosyl)aminobenzene 5'-phosphate synthase
MTTLNDNTAGMGNFLAEWGLSILLETEDQKILLDTGTSNSAVHNAEALGIDLSLVDRIVLSHGHGDHTGGLRDVLRKMNKEIEIIAHPDVWQAKYDKRKDQPYRYIGIPFQREALETLGARFYLTRQPFNISEDILTTGEVPMVTDYETIDPFIFVKEGNTYRTDQVMDDQAVIVKTELGLAIFLGCAHRGMLNTIYQAQKITGVSEIFAVIGGAHLITASRERLEKTLAALKKLGIQKMGLCHCTDLPAASVLAHEFGDVFFFNKAGTSIELA